MIYLDNAATTKLSEEVLSAMMPYLTEEFGNPGSIHKLGRRAADGVAKARVQVASLINCSPEQLIFTSGGTEANNLAFDGIKDHLTNINKKHIITTAVEHESVLKSVKKLCIKHEFHASFIGVNRDCSLNMKYLKQRINCNTGLISIMHINNETGAVYPIREIGLLCKQMGVLFHVDCVQSAGSEKIDVEEFGCDLLTISSHKIHGPKGMGALFVKDKSLLQPMICGGNLQEHGIRGGTENVPGIVGFGRACELVKNNLVSYSNNIKEMSKAVRYELTNQTDNSRLFELNGNSSSSKVLNFKIDGVDSQSLILALENKGIYVSAGSACNQMSTIPSHVLLAMGLTKNEAMSSIRISFDRKKLDNISYICDSIHDTVEAVATLQLNTDTGQQY